MNLYIEWFLPVALIRGNNKRELHSLCFAIGVNIEPKLIEAPLFGVIIDIGVVFGRIGNRD